MDKEPFEYGFCVWLLAMEWKVMFSLVLELFSSVRPWPFTKRTALGQGGTLWLGEPLPGRILPMNPWTLMLFRWSVPFGH